MGTISTGLQFGDQISQLHHGGAPGGRICAVGSAARQYPAWHHPSGGGLLQGVAVLSLGRPLDEHAHWIHQKILGALSATPPDWHSQQPLPFKKRWGEERVYLPMEAPFPVSAQYGVYAEGPDYVSDKSSLVIINPAQRAGVYCDPDYNLPNPSCMGLILLGNDEVATIDVNYEALGMLQEVVASMIDAARAIRVDCPVDAPAA